MELGPHASFILAAYAATVVVVAALMLWITIDYRAQRRTLAQLEERGVTRRSGVAARQAAPSMQSEAR